MLKKRYVIWIISIFISLIIFIYQRYSGPTYPVNGKVLFQGKYVRYKFPRSCTINEKKCLLRFYSEVDGYVLYKRYKIDEPYSRIEFVKKDGQSYAILPDDFPAAGKIVYDVFINSEPQIKINSSSIVLRFKNSVPLFILIMHIIFMFLFMIFSTYIFVSNNVITLDKKIFYINYIFLIIGGFIYGALLQKYAFGQYWTGFPFGFDLTDNKTLIIFLFWSYSLYKLIKGVEVKRAINISYILTIIVYLIPHSLFGSEYRYR